jgi:hypothetical protein
MLRGPYEELYECWEDGEDFVELGAMGFRGIYSQ